MEEGLREIVQSPSGMINVGSLRLSRQKQSHAEMGLCLSKFPET